MKIKWIATVLMMVMWWSDAKADTPVQGALRRMTVRSSQDDPDFGEGSRFIFYAVLEGCYEDGVSNAEIDQILLRKPDKAYFHFIYACPVCTSTIWALQSYRNRPDSFYSLKRGHSGTFGTGLSVELHAQLFDKDAHVRLAAINTLMQRWMMRRMDSLRLTSEEHASLLKKLEAMRRRGMDVLMSFRHHEPGTPGAGVEMDAPAYVDLDECAVCNGAVGKPMKLPGDRPPH